MQMRNKESEEEGTRAGIPHLLYCSSLKIIYAGTVVLLGADRYSGAWVDGHSREDIVVHSIY